MDFGKLLHVAKKNSSEENEARCYSTKFSPPKKETKDKSLSSGIKRFLAKRDEEEREKERQLRENRERLEAMRTNKSKNKINKMLKVIKSANKSVLSQEEGSDSGSAPTAGLQPDEDDYGYVSQESSAIYKKLMEKYKDTDESPQKSSGRSGSNISSTVHKRPDPVSVAVKKDNNNKARKPPQPSTTVTGKSDNSRTSSFGGSRPPLNGGRAVAPKPKPIRRAPPPVVNFEALLKLAEKKQFEPIKVDQADTASRKDERPMTQKEKREHEERQRMAEARRKRLESENYDYRQSKAGPAESAAASVTQRKEKAATSAPQSSSLNGRPGTSRPPNSLSNQNASGRPQQPARPMAAPSRDQPRSAPTNNNRPQVTASSATAPAKTRPFPPADVQQTRSFPPDDVVRRAAPPQSRPFPPADVRRRPGGGAGGTGPSRDFKRPRLQEEPEADYYDSEEDDYDSEMDDFIDDGPLGQSDVSQCIKEIFGYDKSRYRDEDFDDREMESSFAQQMREESYSRKVGRQEDEADMKQEALDKARKAALKRSAKRS